MNFRPFKATPEWNAAMAEYEKDPKSPPQPAASVEQLLPCPFCGSDEGLTVGETKCTALVRWWSVECHGCCVSNTANTEAEAIAEWNTRLIAAPPADGVPAGFVLVPIEATEAMINAGKKAWLGNVTIDVPAWSRYMAETWSAMLKGAPKAPTAPIREAGADSGLYCKHGERLFGPSCLRCYDERKAALSPSAGAGVREAARALLDFIGDKDKRVYASDPPVKALLSTLGEQGRG